MAHIDPTTKTTYASTNWSHYHLGRPPYPASLTSIITTYHATSPTAEWTRLIDIGSGSGLAATPFLPHFRTIHCTDPSPSNLQQAEDYLSTVRAEDAATTTTTNPTAPGAADTIPIAATAARPKLEFTQCTGEDAHRVLLASAGNDAQADMLICATAAHFMQPDALIASCEKLLRPGGTLAVYSYWMPTFPDHSPKLERAFAEAVEGVLLRPLGGGGGGKREKGEKGEVGGTAGGEEREAVGKSNGHGHGDADDDAKEKSRANLAIAISRRFAGSAVLDSLPIPQESFTDVRRISFNHASSSSASDLDEEGVSYRTTFLPYAPATFSPHTASRVDAAHEPRTHYLTGRDAEADGWSLFVDKEWFRKFFDTLRPAVVGDLEFEKVRGRFEEVLAEEGGDYGDGEGGDGFGGVVRTLWPAYLVLARRREIV